MDLDRSLTVWAWNFCCLEWKQNRGRVSWHDVPDQPHGQHEPGHRGRGPVLAAAGADQGNHGQLPQGDCGEHSELSKVSIYRWKQSWCSRRVIFHERLIVHSSNLGHLLGGDKEPDWFKMFKIHSYRWLCILSWNNDCITWNEEINLQRVNKTHFYW